jgi:hypothetical protein
VISDPLFSNGSLLRFHHSGFQPSCHNKYWTTYYLIKCTPCVASLIYISIWSLIFSWKPSTTVLVQIKVKSYYKRMFINQLHRKFWKTAWRFLRYGSRKTRRRVLNWPFLTSTRVDPLLLKYTIDTSHFVLMKLTEIEVSRNNVNSRVPASLHCEFNSPISVFAIQCFSLWRRTIV